STAIAAFEAQVTVGGLGPWSYAGQLTLRRRAGHWLVAWSPAAIHPALRSGQHLARTRTLPPRSDILAADGSKLTTTGTSVTVGLEPDHVKDRQAVLDALQQTIGADPVAVGKSIDGAASHPSQFLAVAEVEEARFAAVKPTLNPIPGVLFRRHPARLAATGDLAAHVVGSVGPVTAEQVAKLGPTVLAGDLVGQSGLEAAAQRQLAGTPGGDVHVADAIGATVASLQTFPGAPGQAVRTSLNLQIQKAAEHALDGVAQPAALVAIQASTGAVEASVSRPVGQEFDRALDGRYPPGSTFKVITTTALLGKGITPATPVTCPPSIVAGGRKFTNFEGETQPTLSFTQAFAESCNTAFIGLSSRLDAADLVGAANLYGFGLEPGLGLPAVGGRLPQPADATELAADAIGQGRVDASPLAMAEVAAAVDSGAWRPPTLAPGLGPGPAPAAAPRPLDPAPATSLRQLMAEVVAQGTGRAAAVPGPAVSGKTGTAEFGSAQPPQTHAWFIGFRGDLAFAVLVEGGGVGGQVAAPIAARFLEGVPAG
ncbi:MAG TPA: penicillin-binding transpeptidase domain-containing protein, partial [Acidimicrobiales bacterium]